MHVNKLFKNFDNSFCKAYKEGEGGVKKVLLRGSDMTTQAKYFLRGVDSLFWGHRFFQACTANDRLLSRLYAIRKYPDSMAIKEDLEALARDGRRACKELLDDK